MKQRPDNAHAPDAPDARRSATRRTGRWGPVIAAAALAAGGLGLAGSQSASADLSAGDRPVFVPITPCRLADTRPAPNNVNVPAAPVGTAQTLNIPAEGGKGKCTGTSAIPADATALSINVTALGATVQSFLTIWGDGIRPDAASLNPAPNQPPVPNAVNTPLGADGSFNLYNNAGSVTIVIDVNGYYIPHDHDDRYAKIGDSYTKAESDARYTTQAQVDATVNAARPSGSSEYKNDASLCANDDTGPGEASDGQFKDCVTTSVGSVGSHTAMIVADVGWYSSGGTAALGECQLKRDGVALADTTIQMGEAATDNSSPSAARYAGVNTIVGPFTGTAVYSIGCRERSNDMGWTDMTLSVMTFPA